MADRFSVAADNPGGSSEPRQDRAPTLALPKGGGALRDIGEKFSVNALTGTGSLSVPIAVSRDRHSGVAPHLVLTYDTGSGNGPFGLGWSLEVPSISRRTDKEIPRYLDGESSDAYLITGAEDLVPLYTFDGTTWNQDLPPSVGFRVERYRPRTEGLFSRIERHIDLMTGDVHWRSVSKENIVSTYGRTTATRIYDPADPARTFRWLIDETRDDRGNIITYEYKQENRDHVDAGLPYERYRLEHVTELPNRYVKRIRYGNTTPNVAADWAFTVVFDYGDHDLSAPAIGESSAWPCRVDPFSVSRPGFEVRSYRLCRRILMFHTFDELGDTPCLVQSTDLTYDELPTATFLMAIAHRGYIRDPDAAAYRSDSLPPIEFGYQPRVLNTTIQDIDRSSLNGLPNGLDGSDYQWVDLEGEGVTGILTEQASTWYYKRNLGGGAFAATEPVATLPRMANLRSGHQQLLQVAGDGRTYLVDYSGLVPGYQERDAGSWGPFTPFASLPRVAWDDPNLRFADLNGDGFADVLITGTQAWQWYGSQARDGFTAAEELVRDVDENRGPALVFADGTQSIHFADMSGDGLSDLVRIRNGEVSYWPNLGWGRFGPKVLMANAPLFDYPEQFDQKRIRLCDVDGSGTTDIIYLGDRARLWFNECGNRFSDPQALPALPEVTSLVHVMPVDLMGNGTSCLVWSSSDPADAARPMRYIDLMSGIKPFLLNSMTNNLGLETRMTYATSTKWYLEDAAAGTPWLTKLPFPVHVVERVETRDRVADTKLVTSYRYRHGYYDGFEREFRGFAYVEQRDTDSFSTFNGSGVFSAPPRLVDDRSYVPPVVTKSWYHTGYLLDVGNLSQHFAEEYYAGDAAGALLPDSTIPDSLNAQEIQEACRALRGRMLRQEVYGLDDTPSANHPYTVTEHAYTVREVQPLLGNQHAVFFVHERASLSYHYERQPDDPRILSELTVHVDEYGTVTESASIAYARRAPAFPEQAQPKITYTTSQVINRTSDQAFYQVGLASDEAKYELTGLAPPLDLPIYAADELGAAFAAAAWIAFESTSTAGVLEKRLLKRTRTTYCADGAGPERPAGSAGVPALVFQTYSQALTPGLLGAVFGATVSSQLLHDEGGYVQLDGDWYAPSGTHQFVPALFYRPAAFIDAFGQTSTLVYDHYVQLPVASTDAIGNVVTARNNYRVLHPYALTDPNGNRTVVRFDALGMVVATAVTGKPDAPEGDVMDDSSPESLPGDDPTTRLEYDLDRVMTDGTPAYVRTFVREQHGAANPRWQESRTYSDGSGREAMRKIQAEPDPGGSAAARWIGTGRTIYDNKGNAVKKYEPYFSASADWDTESAIVESGVTPIFRYDPIGRLVRTDLPNGTFSTVEFDAWEQITSDENDTVLESAWRTARAALPVSHPERRALDVSAPHAHTPAIGHLDPLSRAARVVVDNGGGATFVTQHVRDIEGHQTAVIDPRGNLVAEHTYDLLGRKLLARSADAGQTLTLLDVAGSVIRSWDSRGHVIRKRYDALRRNTHIFVQQGGNPESLHALSVYGDGLVDAAARNLHDKVYQEYEGSGVATQVRCDFKGHVVEAHRRLALALHAEPDWSALAGLSAPADIEAAAEPLLEPESFTTLTSFDALNRVTRLTTPDGSTTRPTYNEANLIEQVHVAVRGGVENPYVTNIDYNAKGQRTLIAFGNSTQTTYAYDAATFRLTRISTTGVDGALQDLSYVYDPGGRVVQVSDAAQPTIFFNNAVVDATARYEYDPAYRLSRAEGREQAANGTIWQPNQTDIPLMALPHANDVQALRRWAETYTYDPSGNIAQVAHTATLGNWTRIQQYAAGNNRLMNSSLPADPPGAPSLAYAYDAHGNLTSMPHLSAMDWNLEDQLQQVGLGGGGDAYYAYDSKGHRIRAVVERPGGATEERIYFGGYEVYRERDGGGHLQLERQSLHVMDGTHRIALVETKTCDLGAAMVAPVPLPRYQLSNHIASALLELDGDGHAISYEEYFPFGGTSYRSAQTASGVSLKRYRYIGVERDDETGFCASGARYYAPWLARWTSCDPAGLTDGINVYSYVSNNPLSLSDPTGMWGWREVAVIAAIVVVGTVITVATAGAAGPLVVGAVASIGLTGTAATVVTGVAVGAIAGAVGGAAAGAAGETTRQVVHNERLGLGHEHMSGGRIASAAGQGAVEGAIVGGAIGGVAAFATTAAGAATAAAIGRVGQRVLPAAVRSAGGAIGRGAVAAVRAVARAPVARQIVAGATRALEAVGERSLALGARAAAGVFQEGSAGAQSVARFVASGGSAADAFGVAAEPRIPGLRARYGAYDPNEGHHVHQSASYSPGGPSATTNPNHDAAIAVDTGSAAQHRLGDSVQRRLNRAIQGLDYSDAAPNPVQIQPSGNGTLAPTPNPYFEDVKGYYSLRAIQPPGIEHPNQALFLVNESSAQLSATGTAPVRIPSR